VGLSHSAYYAPAEHWTVRDSEIVGALARLVEGWNHKRVNRVYKLMNLHLRRRPKRRLPKRVQVPLYVPRLPDKVWSADFARDALFNARRFRTFNVVDDFNREALHIEIDTSITSTRLVRIFERLRTEHALPQVLRTDNGPEFLGEIFTSWARQAGMAIQYIQPGKPNQNAYIERFNRTYREELLDLHLFASLEDVREATYWWMIKYNEHRPHDLLGDLTPLEARAKLAGNSTFNLSA
jgi:putative transposase